MAEERPPTEEEIAHLRSRISEHEDNDDGKSEFTLHMCRLLI